MPQKYEVINSKLNLDHPIYLHTYKVINVSEPIAIAYERGIYEPRVEFFYDVDLDDGRSVRLREDFGKDLKIGDEVHYNISVDDFIKFTPDHYDIQLKLVS